MDPPAAAPPPRALDRGRRDEWSECGVLSLLEVYSSKWLLRNRAKLKGSDWDDIARQVSARCSAAPKTPIQCKNKIESMKKRFRAEPADSSWHFYKHMEDLLKGLPKTNTGINIIDPKPDPDPADSNQDDGSNTLRAPIIDINTDANANNNEEAKEAGSEEDKNGGAGTENSPPSPPSPLPKRRKRAESEVAESVRMLARSILKIEQTRMEMYRESERMKVEADIKRGEMELKRTEIIANTQLQIAKLFARRSRGSSSKSEGSVPRTELEMLPRREEMGD